MNVIELLKNIDGVKEVKEMAENCRWFVYVEPNENDLEFLIELTFCYPDNKSQNSLPNRWFKNGFIGRVLENYIAIDTYLTTEKCCVSGDNPTVIKQGNRDVINFENMLEITEENVKYLIELTIKEYRAREKNKEWLIWIEQIKSPVATKQQD